MITPAGVVSTDRNIIINFRELSLHKCLKAFFITAGCADSRSSGGALNAVKRSKRKYHYPPWGHGHCFDAVGGTYGSLDFQVVAGPLALRFLCFRSRRGSDAKIVLDCEGSCRKRKSDSRNMLGSRESLLTNVSVKWYYEAT